MPCIYRIVAGVLLCISCTARADIYAFTDEDGTTHFSNVPDDERYEVRLASARSESGGAGTAANPVNAIVLARAELYDEVIEEAAAHAEVDFQLLRAIIVAESAFDERAVSNRGASGLMQLMPVTAARYGAIDLFNPRQNVSAGARYLRDLIDRYDQNLELALAAYNAGEDAVERYGREIPPFKETRAYVPRVLKIYTTLRDLEERT